MAGKNETTGRLESRFTMQTPLHTLCGYRGVCMFSPSENFREGGAVLPTSSHRAPYFKVVNKKVHNDVMH